jgi:hypothetical protein
MRAELFTVSIASLTLAVFVGCTPVARDFGGPGGFGGLGGFGGSGAGGSGSGASPATGATGGADGGDGGPQVTPAFVDGSRLHAHVQDGGGGAVALEYWVDQQLNVSCQFLPTTDGKFHCAPKQGNSIAYSDSTCSTKVAVLSACEALSPYVVEQSTTPVCQQSFFDSLQVPASTIYAIGQKLGTGLVYTLDQSSPPQCVTDGALPNGADYYQVTVAQLSGFVSATLAQEDRDGRLYAEFLDGSDGSRQMTGQIYDHSMSDLPCSLVITGTDDDPGFICVPGIVATNDAEQQYFADATCATPAAEEQDYAACQAPQVLITIPKQTGCALGGGDTYNQPGTDITAGNICRLDSSTGACSCQTDTSGNHYFTLGAPIPASTFATLGVAKYGTGRLQNGFATTTAGGQLTPPNPNGYWDTMANTSCEVQLFADGSSRCVPDTVLNLYAGNTPTYMDSTCKTQVAMEYYEAGCPPAPFTAIVEITNAKDACSQQTVTATYAVGTQYTGAMVYQQVVGAGCLGQAVATDAVYYPVGAAVDPTTLFAAVIEKTE